MSKCKCCSCHSDSHSETLCTNEIHEHSHKEDSKIKRLLFILGVIAFASGIIFQLLDVAFVYPILYIVAYLLIGFDIFCDLIKDFSHKEFFGENTLMVFSSLGAMIIGEMAEGCAVLFLFTIGEAIEGRAQRRAERNIELLLSMKPKKARLIDANDNESEVLPENLKVGDIVMVFAGEVIPCDGEIIQGCANVDTSQITGESVPVFFDTGKSVSCGCISLDGVLKIKVTVPYCDNTFSKIVTTLKNSNEKKSKSENFIRKFARIYTPSVVILAIVVALSGSIFSGDYSVWCYRALVFLASSCPCAFVISVPLIFFFGIGELSKKGFLVKGSEFIEKLSNITTIAFDKTGTITKGTLRVVNFICSENYSQEELLGYALSLESHSSHPIAKEIVSYVKTKKAILFEAENIREISGIGVCGNILGKEVCVGNNRLFEGDSGFDVSGTGTRVFIVVNNRVEGVFELLDEIREDANNLFVRLSRLGIRRNCILTGDNSTSAEAVAKQIGVKEVYSELLPDDKAEILEKIIKENNNGTTAFVGDGINDAPVLALADVGIAMGNNGAGVAVESSDAVILKNTIEILADAISISRKMINRVRFSILFALTVKFAILLLSLFGFANMWLAVFGDVGITLILILNSKRRYR